MGNRIRFFKTDMYSYGCNNNPITIFDRRLYLLLYEEPPELELPELLFIPLELFPLLKELLFCELLFLLYELLFCELLPLL